MTIAVVFVFFVLPYTLMAREPSCSRFDYEEKTLEKMIRLEVKCEAILTDVTVVKQRLNKEVTATNKEIERKIEEIDQTLSDISKVKKDVQEQVQAAISGLSTSVVAFKAEMTESVKLSRGSTLLFQRVVSNDGSGYDSDTSIFTAPVGGVYLLTLQLCTEGKDNLVVETVVDGTVKNRVLIYDHDRSTCHDHTNILTLRSGNKLTFKVGSRSTSTVHLMVDSLERINFAAGVLVVKQ